MQYSLALAFTLGLFSSLHCIGMCGGIVSALSFGVSTELRASNRRLVWFVLCYNGGRIFSYTLAGLAVSLLGVWLADAAGLRIALQLAAAMMILLIGLHIGNWFPRLAMIERIGLPVWRRLEPLAHALHPVRHPFTAFVFGMLWGWVPCGLVYSVLLSALAMESSLDGALYMLAFGLGTLPSMTATGLLAGRIHAYTRQPLVRRWVAASVILMGIISLWYALAVT